MTVIFDIFGVLVNCKSNNLRSKVVSENPFHIIQNGQKLLEHCISVKSQNKNIKLFALSNCDAYIYGLLLTYVPEIMNKFDDVIISEHAGYKKPNLQIFNFILDKHKLNPFECIFIDDQELNVQAATTLGMTGIICDTHEKVLEQLKNLIQS